MFNRGMVNIINHLYCEQPLVHEATKRNLHCYDDHVVALTREQIVTAHRNEWNLAPNIIGFLNQAEETLAHFPPKDWLFGSPLRDPLSQAIPNCFVAMPYGPSWFLNVRASLEQAVQAAGYSFHIASDISHPGPVMQQVWEDIREAHVVMADLTGLNANVMYEVGIAHALGKEVILITQEKEKLPFDVQSMRWIPYNLATLGELKNKLRSALFEVWEGLRLRDRNRRLGRAVTETN